MYYRSKPIGITARLRRANFANYYNYYHSGDASTDHVCKLLTSAVEKNMISSNTDQFKSPVTPEGFYFKSDGVQCRDINGRTCLIDDCFDRDVSMSIIIRPYNFVKDSKQLAGLTIIAKDIKVKKDKF